MKKEKWLNDRKAELLPCSYFHNVFTLPHELNPVALCNKKVVFNLLFKSVSEVLKDFAADPQWRLNGKIGILAILHTWSQILLDHFHLHCLIPAGALSFDAEKWTPAGKKFLFKTSSLGKAFKTRFIVKFREAYEKGQLNFPGDAEIFGTPEGFNRLIKNISGKQWVVFSKAPFAGPEQVLEYLGRYTHRVAISNHRIKSIDDGKIVFSYKDRDDQDKVKHMTLDADEFIRRFLLHVLPDGFMKIRYYGFLANRYKAKNIKTIRHLIGQEEPMYEKQTESAQEILLRITGEDITVCPVCKKGKMRIIDDLTRYNAFTFKKQKRILKLTPDT